MTLRAFARLLVACLAALLAAFMLFTLGMRLRGPTAGQQAALAELAKPPPPVAGRDASDALWLLDHEVPAAEQVRVAAAWRQYLDRVDALVIAGRVGEATRLSSPLAAYRRRPEVGPTVAGICRDADIDCLVTVRSHLAAAEAMLRSRRGGLEAVHALSGYDGFRQRVRPSSHQALPPFKAQRVLLRTQAAVDFARGRKQQAMATLCADIGGWRRIGGDTDSLVASMVGAAFVQQDLLLLSQMVAELPVVEALPAACDAALVPSRDAEYSLCLAVRNEFGLLRSLYLREMPARLSPFRRALMGLAFDPEHATAIAAPEYARFCQAAALRDARLDRSWQQSMAPAPVCGRIEAFADPVGCELARLSSAGELAAYADRRLDLAASLALMRTVLWLREQPASEDSRSDLLARRPDTLQLRREPRLSADGRWLSISLLDRRREQVFRLAVAAGDRPGLLATRSP